jgi:hypothetical protein
MKSSRSGLLSNITAKSYTRCSDGLGRACTAGKMNKDCSQRSWTKNPSGSSQKKIIYIMPSPLIISADRVNPVPGKSTVLALPGQAY